MDKLYSHLNEARREIRLLLIQPPSEPDMIIDCSLESISLDDHPEYIALSYVWGDPKITEEIRVNSVPLAVTTNLAAALRQLRTYRSGEGINPNKGRPSLLWVDAICINQQDISERSSQVQLMTDIYRSAVRIISWLGPEADGSADAFRNLRAISQEIAQLLHDGDRLEWLRRYPQLIAEGTETRLSKLPSWKDISRLWDREYWKRTWILQELILAKEVLLMCGEETLAWEDILRIHNWSITIKTADKRPPFLDMVQWAEFTAGEILSSTSLKSIKIIELFRTQWHRTDQQTVGRRIGLIILDLSRDLKATDPRDKVYGVLGVSGVRFVPDYAKSVRDVYTEAAFAFLGIYGLTRTLNSARKDNIILRGASWEHEDQTVWGKDTRGNPFNLPSWVPDWSSTQSKLPSRKYFLDNTRPNPGPITFRRDVLTPDVLTVVGVRISSVAEFGSVSLGVQRTPVPTRVWLLCQEVLERYRDRLYPTGIPPLQALLRLIVNDEDHMGEKEPLKIPSDAFFNLGATLILHAIMHDSTTMQPSERFGKYLPKLGLAADESFARSFSDQFLGPGSDPPPWSGPGQALFLHHDFTYKVLLDLVQILNQALFFYTDDGYFGYGSFEIQAGDFVCALQGCEFPVILRKEDVGFTFVGTCSVQGLVDEGILKSVVDGATSLEEFDLH